MAREGEVRGLYGMVDLCKELGLDLEATVRKIAEKFPNTWKLNNTLLNNPWVKEVSREINIH